MAYGIKSQRGLAIAAGVARGINNARSLNRANQALDQQKEKHDMYMKKSNIELDILEADGKLTPLKAGVARDKLKLASKEAKADLEAYARLNKGKRTIQEMKNELGVKALRNMSQNVVTPGEKTTVDLGEGIKVERGSAKVQTDIGSAEGLSGEQQIQGRALARKIAGVRGAEKILPSIYAEMKTGKTIDQIEDALRFSGQSEGFTGDIRNAVQSIMVNESSEGKTQRAMDYIDDLYSDGNEDEAKEQVKRLARKQAGTAQEAQLNGKERTIGLMEEIQDDLNTLENNGIKTNIFSGTQEEINAKIGRVNNVDMRQVATKIAVAVQNYRRSMSGVAFSVPESEEYKKIFPSISKTANFNKANIDALSEVMRGDLDTFYSLSMGKEAYSNMFGEQKEVENFDREGALAAGYTEEEIDEYLKTS